MQVINIKKYLKKNLTAAAAGESLSLKVTLCFSLCKVPHFLLSGNAEQHFRNSFRWVELWLLFQSLRGRLPESRDSL